jgi:hypothetical protein
MRALRLLTVPFAAAVLVAGVLPATAGPGPVVIDSHDSEVPTRAFDITSSTSGTVYTADAGTGVFGHAYLVRAPMTTSSPVVDLGDRAMTGAPGSEPSISGTNVAVPATATLGGPVTSVRYCAVASCPTMSTFTVPSGYTYIGNGDDRALLYNATTNDLALAPWNGSAMTLVSLTPTGAPAPESAVGDTAGVLLRGGGSVTYVNRSTLAVTIVDGANSGVLTPSFIVWYLVGTGPSFDQTVIRTVARSTPSATPGTQATLAGAPDFNDFVANDTGVAYLVPQGDEEGSNLLYSLAYGTPPGLYPRPIDSATGLGVFEGGSQFVVDDDRAGTLVCTASPPARRPAP